MLETGSEDGALLFGQNGPAPVGASFSRTPPPSPRGRGGRREGRSVSRGAPVSSSLSCPTKIYKVQVFNKTTEAGCVRSYRNPANTTSFHHLGFSFTIGRCVEGTLITKYINQKLDPHLLLESPLEDSGDSARMVSVSLLTSRLLRSSLNPSSSRPTSLRLSLEGNRTDKLDMQSLPLPHLPF